MESTQEAVGPGPLRPIADPRLRHFASSAIGAIFWLLFAYANIKASVESHRLIGVGVGILGLWAAVLFAVRRPPTRVSRSPMIWVVAFAGTFGASLLRPGGPDLSWTDPVGLALQTVGVAIGAFGFMALGRSLGLVPADRGLVTSGAYRVVRHPLYASYFIAETGYLIQSPRLWNAGVLGLVWICQIMRIVGEERLLSADGAYRRYMRRTPWRLFPGVW
ncbi:MAG: isoprenylcysteine carboxyl methyltransferase [Candidatus Rokuibacteriota bacterium]|nr:MAG: isoprenylcysteine carboxyl methyltransferase [Candidatus Rokubacteria bacterium]